MSMFKSSEVKKGIEGLGSFIKENEERITGISGFALSRRRREM